MTADRRATPVAPPSLQELLLATGEDRLPMDPRVATPIIRGFAWTVGAAGLVWGSIYLLLGVPDASAFPFGFSLASGVNLVAFRMHRRLRVFAGTQIFLILVIPLVLSLALGGFMPSGGVGLWALLAPIGALLTLGSDWAAAILAVFVVLTGITALPATFPWPTATLAPDTVRMFGFLNVVAVSLVAFVATRMFLVINQRLSREQERLRDVEQAYVRQEAMMRQQERLATLGRMSAGVAHELNNPSAAAGRAAGQLEEVIERLTGHATSLLRLRAAPDALEALRPPAADARGETKPLERGARRDASDPFERADREERLAEWLEAASADDAWELATGLAALGLDTTILEAVAARYGSDSVVALARWTADEAKARELAGEVRTSAGRIYGIVGALKGYSHMDRGALVPVDVDRGIDETLMILSAKLTGLEVVRERGTSLPPLEGNPGELNQVWTNLIANAAEAMDGAGTLTIRTVPDEGAVVVEVEDDGPGIPPELVDRVFDPFVTTKPPGEGTGLGLNISHQIVVERHHGTIAVYSRPGRTRFVVRLPAVAASERTSAAEAGRGAAGADAARPDAAERDSAEAKT